MTNRLSEDAAPDNEQSGTVQTDNTSSAALDKTGARRKRSASWGTAATTEKRTTSGLNLLITCQKMSGSYGGPWTICPSSGDFCTLLAVRAFVFHAACPRIKGTHCARTLGWHACASSWRFLGAQASIFRAAALLLTVCASATSPRIFHTAPGAAQAARQQWQTWRAATAYQTGGCGRF